MGIHGDGGVHALGLGALRLGGMRAHPLLLRRLRRVPALQAGLVRLDLRLLKAN